MNKIEKDHITLSGSCFYEDECKSLEWCVNLDEGDSSPIQLNNTGLDGWYTISGIKELISDLQQLVKMQKTRELP